MPQPEDTPSVLVLGAGIVGICTALSLLERGVNVRVIDRADPGQATSFGNAGVVSPWSIIPQSLPGTWKSIPKMMFGGAKPLAIHPRLLGRMIPWGLRFLARGTPARVRAAAETMSILCGPSIELYEKHLRGTGEETLLRESCYIHAFRDGSRANLQNLDYAIRAEKGADLELVGRDGLAALEPVLSPAFEAAIVIAGQARVRSPGRLGAVLAAKAERLGAEFLRADIKAIRRDPSGWVVDCQSQTHRAEQIVIALGVWSRDLLKALPVRLPLMAERGYHVEFAEPGIELTNSIMDMDAKMVASSMEGGLRMAGQSEFGPIDAPPDPRREARMIDIASAALTGLSTAQPKFWMGRRPSFPDNLPMIGAVKGQPGLFFNFGHSHYGLMMAPKSASVLAQEMRGERPNTGLEGSC